MVAVVAGVVAIVPVFICASSTSRGPHVSLSLLIECISGMVKIESLLHINTEPAKGQHARILGEPCAHWLSVDTSTSSTHAHVFAHVYVGVHVCMCTCVMFVHVSVSVVLAVSYVIMHAMLMVQ